MKEITSILREINKLFLIEGYKPPVSIEIGEDAARALDQEVHMMLKYSADEPSFPHNMCTVGGVLIVAPKNFAFTKTKASREDWNK